MNDEWEAEKKSDELVVSYVLSLRERLESMVHVQRNLRKAQRYQKAWYDMSSRERYFQARWPSPHPVAYPHQQADGTVAGTLSSTSEGVP